MSFAYVLRWVAPALLALVSPPVQAQFTQASLPPGLTDVGFMAAPGFMDVDEDGDFDLFVGRSDGGISYFENTGTPAAPAFTERTGTLNPLSDIQLPGSSTIRRLDFGGDGTEDLVLGDINGTIYAYANGGPTSTPQFTDGGSEDLGILNAVTAVADFDGDGDPDILSGASDGTLVLFQNDGSRASGNFTLVTGPANPLDGLDAGFSSAPVLADLDGDGDIDVLVGNLDGTLAYAPNTGGPTGPIAFDPLTDASSMGLTDVGYSAVPAVGDLDGDGDLDVLVGRSDGTFAYFKQGAPSLTTSLTGSAGWRMLASPVGSASLDAVFGDNLYVQGIPGADASTGPATLFRYDETLSGAADIGYEAPSSMTETTGSGVGYFAYVFEDDDPGASGVQGGFPKPLDAPAGGLVTRLFTWGDGGEAPLHYSDTGSPLDDGWNLLGNPYAGWMDWDATAASGMNGSAYVYDAASSTYLAYSRGVGGTLPGGVIGPFQGFWVQATAASPTLTADPTPSDGGPLYRTGEAPLSFAFTLETETGPQRAEAILVLGVQDATDGLDAFDARLLDPPASSYLVLGTRTKTVALAVDARDTRDTAREIDLELAMVRDDVNAGGPVTLSWRLPTGLPPDWTVSLLDRESNAVTDLRTTVQTDMLLRGTGEPSSPRLSGPVFRGTNGATRFALRLGAGSAVDTETETLRQLEVGTPAPNPASGRVALSVGLLQAADVRIAAFDALGRRVGELATRSLPPGRHSLELSLDGLVPGVYVLRVQIGDDAHTRRLTVAR